MKNIVKKNIKFQCNVYYNIFSVYATEAWLTYCEHSVSVETRVIAHFAYFLLYILYIIEQTGNE